MNKVRDVNESEGGIVIYIVYLSYKYHYHQFLNILCFLLLIVNFGPLFIVRLLGMSMDRKLSKSFRLRLNLHHLSLLPVESVIFTYVLIPLIKV